MNYPITAQNGYRIPSVSVLTRSDIQRQQHLIARRNHEQRRIAIHRSALNWLDQQPPFVSPIIEWRPLV